MKCVSELQRVMYRIIRNLEYQSPHYSSENPNTLRRRDFLSTRVCLYFVSYWIKKTKKKKTCPRKRPNCPSSQTYGTKSGARRAGPGTALVFSQRLDVPTVTAPRAFVKLVYTCLSPFIWQLVFFSVTSGARILSSSQNAAQPNERAVN